MPPDRPWIFVVAVVLFVLLTLVMLAGCGATLGTGGGPNGSATATQQDGPTTVAQNSGPGIGGTGKTPGIGGTGQTAVAPPGIGGTGIIGTVTGFGSILVNGYRVEYAPNVPVRFKDSTVRADALRVGHVVEVEADTHDGRLQARRIGVRHEVAGPIERIDPARRMAVVFGQRIEIPSGVVALGRGSQRLSITNLAVGDHIDVSGLRRANGVIAASRVAKTGPGAAAVLRGRVMASGPDGFTVNGVRVTAPRGSRPAAVVSGQHVKIVGTAVRGQLRARRITPLPARPFSGRVRHLSVEGYVSRTMSGAVAVGQVPITQLPRSARIRAGARVILDGPVDAGGRFAPSRLRQPLIDLDFRGEPSRRGRNRIEPAPRPRGDVTPPPPVIRGPAPRSRIYRPPPSRRSR